MHQRRWWGLWLWVAVCLVAVLTVANGPANAQRGMLRVGRGPTSRSLDPHVGARLDDRVVLYTLYEPLIDADKNGNFVPVLAKSWEVGATGRVITFHLREGVVFHDGTPFNAEVAKWNIERVLNPETRSEHATRFEGIIQGMQAADPYTLRIYLTKPYPALFSELIDRPGMMVSPEAVKKFGQDFGRNPIGTGPFRFVEWISGSRVVVQRFDRYWNRQAIRSEGITFQDVLEPAVAAARLKSGEFDLVVTEIPAMDLVAFRTQPAYRVVESPGHVWESLQMKVDTPPFDNRNLRQAIAAAINREQLVSTIYRGVGMASGKFFLEGWWSDARYGGAKYDPDLARNKLRESGYLDRPTPLVLFVPSSDTQVGEILQAQFTAIGLRVSIRLVSPRDHYPMILRGELPFTVPVRWTPRVDPHGLAYILWHSNGYANTTQYRNAQVDRLLDEASQIYDKTRRTEIYRQVERAIVDEAPNVVYSAAPYYAVMREGLREFAYGFDLIPRMGRVWVER